MSDNNVNRRTVLRAATMGSIVAGVPVTVAGERDENNQVPDRVTLDELAIEIAFHPEDSVAAITTLGLGDGYQVYLGGYHRIIDTPRSSFCRG